eukprot:1095803-Pyramimonas_sp.AAC.1
MQLIKRGGPKGGPKVGTHDDANKKIEALRQSQEAEDAPKRADEAGAQAPAPAGGGKGADGGKGSGK